MDKQKNTIDKGVTEGYIQILPFNFDRDLCNIGDKFDPNIITQSISDAIGKRLIKKEYKVSDSAPTIISGEVTKVDIGNRFARYITLGLSGKVFVGVSGTIRNKDREIDKFDFEIPVTSGSWILTPKFLCTKAAIGCGCRIGDMFSR